MFAMLPPGITLRSGVLGGQYDGEVTAITLMYTRLATAEGLISLPNSGVLASASGPRPNPAAAPTPAKPVPRLRRVPAVSKGRSQRQQRPRS
jgi:hypothetical protein